MNALSDLIFKGCAMFKVKFIFKSNDVFTKIAGLIFLLTMLNIASAQSPEELETGVDKPNFSYVKNGTFYLPDGQEVKHFGVNYSPFFAYGYRAIDRLGKSHKEAIDMDLYHIQRLGLTAYRIHVWEKEISDGNGNLLNNKHLELLDYTLAELSKRNIKVILTPIAWWGGGYPEKDNPNGAFSDGYTKNEMNENSDVIKATHTYLAQFVNHLNQYSNVRYKEDTNIIGFELFNEPKHTQSPSQSMAYINGLAQVLKQQNVKQPLFYNISEQGLQLDFAKAVCSANIDGIAYQWYPTGLVRNAKLNANMLINVSTYPNPFSEITECKNKVKIIYEFDPSDTNQSVMYPAMARSFRSAGFQWATQFAYDSSALAHTNTEYSTHYMNLLYSPSRALGLKIAADVFKNLPKNYESPGYPLNNRFEHVSLFPSNDLALLNSATKFINSRETKIQPIEREQLKLVAGVESSPLIKYVGSGAYFFDKVSSGVWTLELYPDVLSIDDAFKSGSSKREVARLYKNMHRMTIDLPDLSDGFYIAPVADLESIQKSKKGAVSVQPGKYILVNEVGLFEQYNKNISTYFPLPDMKQAEVLVNHQPIRQFLNGQKVQISANIQGISKETEVILLLRYIGDRDFQTLNMQAFSGSIFNTQLPDNGSWDREGMIEYAITVKSDNEYITFPGMDSGSPKDWDFVSSRPYWELAIKPTDSPVVIFDQDKDRDHLVYPQKGRSSWETVAGENGLEFALRLGMSSLDTNSLNFLVRTVLAENNPINHIDLSDYQYLVLHVKAVSKTIVLGMDLIDKNGFAFGKDVLVKPQWQTIAIPISSLTPIDSLSTQAYPSFMPLKFANTSEQDTFNTKDLNLIQGLQFRFPSEKLTKSQANSWHSVEIGNVYLAK
jgi:hypothetical protein